MTSTETAPAAAGSGEQAKQAKRPKRLPELDMARGLALVAAGVVLMIPPPGSVPDDIASGIDLPSWLGPAEWSGITVADLLPATFAVLVGVALAMQQQRHGKRAWPWWVGRTALRAAVLIGIGVALTWATGPSVDLPPNPDTVRWTGHLARLGAAAVVAIPLVRLPRWTEVGVASVLLIGHTLWLVRYGTWDPEGSALFGADAAILGASRVVGPLDPTGVVAIAPTLVCILVGFWVGEWITERDRSVGTAGVLLLLGSWAALLGVSFSQLVPVNSTLWTGPTLALGVAVALGLLGSGHLLTRRDGTDALVARLTPLGRNGLVAWVIFVMAGRWLAGSRWYAEAAALLGDLLTPLVAVGAITLAVVFLVLRLTTVMADRGITWRA